MRPKGFQVFTRDVQIPGCNLRALYSVKFGTEGILNKICEILESNRRTAKIQNMAVPISRCYTSNTTMQPLSLVSESSPTDGSALCRVEDMQSVSKAGPRARRRRWCKCSGRVSRWKRSCSPAGVSSSLPTSRPRSAPWTRRPGSGHALDAWACVGRCPLAGTTAKSFLRIVFILNIWNF